MNLRQRVKRLETPHDEANDYLIRDFDALCAERAMNARSPADLADCRGGPPAEELGDGPTGVALCRTSASPLANIASDRSSWSHSV
jgi:hypothetical protein